MSESIDKRERDYQAFGAFLADFVRDLNNSSEDGWSLLVEGVRDQRALRKLGYDGDLLPVSVFARKGAPFPAGAKKVIILTDLDREGAVLASKFVKRLSHEGVRASLSERRRLKAASRGVFLHIENLSRFASPEDGRWDVAVREDVPDSAKVFRGELRRSYHHHATL